MRTFLFSVLMLSFAGVYANSVADGSDVNGGEYGVLSTGNSADANSADVYSAASDQNLDSEKSDDDSFGMFRFVYNPVSFDDFKPSLGSEIVQTMNKSDFFVSYDFWGIGKHLDFGMHYGYWRNFNEGDFTTRVRSLRWGFDFGYHLGSKHLIVLPNATIEHMRYRVLANESQSKIPLEQYVDNRSLDIRFNQFAATVGVKVLWKFKSIFLGVDGGYITNIGDPIVRSVNNRLSTDGKIKFDNYYVGVCLGVFD